MKSLRASMLHKRGLVNSGGATSANPVTGEFKSTHITPLSNGEVDRLNRNRTNPRSRLAGSSGMINSELGVVAGSETSPLRRLSSDGRSPKNNAYRKDLQSETLNRFSGEVFENFKEDKPRKTLENRITEIKVEYQDSIERELEIAQALADEIEHKIERLTIEIENEEAIPAKSEMLEAEDLAAECAKHLRNASQKFVQQKTP